MPLLVWSQDASKVVVPEKHMTGYLDNSYCSWLPGFWANGNRYPCGFVDMDGNKYSWLIEPNPIKFIWKKLFNAKKP